jgi:hypothetical protein
MKIKVKKAVKAQPPEDLEKQIDKAASDYDKASTAAKEAEKVKDKSNQKIKSLAELFGVKNGKEKIIYGRRFEAGFNEVDQPYVDEANLKKVLGDYLYLKVAPKVRVFNADTFKQLVDSGEITQEQAKKLILYKDPQKRIVVRPLKGKPTP